MRQCGGRRLQVLSSRSHWASLVGYIARRMGVRLLSSLFHLDASPAAWAYAMVMPDGSMRNNADDILNIMALSYNPLVRKFEFYPGNAEFTKGCFVRVDSCSGHSTCHTSGTS